MRILIVLVSDGSQDEGGFSCFENHGDPIRFALLKILSDEVIAALVLGCIHDIETPFLRASLQPVLELIGNLCQQLSRDTLSIAIRVEEAQDSFWLLERLDQAIKQNPIETSIAELDAILVMLAKGVHGVLLCGEIPGAYRRERHCGQRSHLTILGYQGRSPWLVSISEYLSTSYDPDCDYVDGVIEERNLGENNHADLQTTIAVCFGNRR